MQKELNPALFSETGLYTTRVVEPTARESQVLLLEQKLTEAHEQIKKLTDSFHQVVQQVGDSLLQIHQRQELIQRNFEAIEKQQSLINRDFQNQLQSLSSRVSDKKASEMKVQELIDRHNGLIKSYEVRLNQVQKLMVEKENQSIQLQSSLNEARMEIARVKRMTL